MPEPEPPDQACGNCGVAGRDVFLMEPDLERCCFICLDGADEERELVPCCSRCYVHVHTSCWRSWRQSQRLAHLRQRISGGVDNTPGVLVCSVCKTGDALIEGEDLSWLDDQRGGLRSSSEDLSLDVTVLCSPKIACMNITILFVMWLLNATVISKHLLFGQLVFLSVVFFYEFGILQVVGLAIYLRASQATYSGRPSPIPLEERRDLELGPIGDQDQ
jgi:hypothetical protein